MLEAIRLKASPNARYKMEIKNDIPTLLYTTSGYHQLITLTEREHQSKSIVTFKIGDFIV